MTETINCSRCGIPLEGQADVGTDKCGWCECDIRNQRRREQEKAQPGSLHPAGSATALAVKCEALEKLVIELTLIAISTAHIQHHHKARLDHLLGELQYAGIESPNDRICDTGNKE